MRSVFNFLIFTGAIVGVLFVAMKMYGSLVGSCAPERIAAVPSPDGEWLAVNDLYSCERGKRVETQVYLAPAKSRGAGLGEFPVLRAQGSTEVGLSWIGNRALRVTYPTDSNAEQLFATGGTGMADDISVEYERLDEDGS